MERIILTVESELFDEVSQEASVRKNVTLRSLMIEIQREFSLPEGNYLLQIKGEKRALDLEKTLEQLNIQTGAEIVFARDRRNAARVMALGGSTHTMIVSSRQAYLVEDETGKVFEIEWQPAIIGRPDANNPVSGQTLAVNLGSFEEARTVSRQHATITERSGVYFVESMAERNPALLNGETIHIGERRSLHVDDKILIGKISLTFKLHESPAPAGNAPTLRQTVT